MRWKGGKTFDGDRLEVRAEVEESLEGGKSMDSSWICWIFEIYLRVWGGEVMEVDSSRRSCFSLKISGRGAGLLGANC